MTRNKFATEFMAIFYRLRKPELSRKVVHGAALYDSIRASVPAKNGNSIDLVVFLPALILLRWG